MLARLKARLGKYAEAAAAYENVGKLLGWGPFVIPGWNGWTRDVDYLYQEIKRANPDYRYRAFPEEFERRYRELKAAIPKLADEEIFFGMQRMLAVLRQGHTILFDVPQTRYLPLYLYAFREGIHIIDAVGGSAERRRRHAVRKLQV
jgi:hypothetical protein